MAKNRNRKTTTSFQDLATDPAFAIAAAAVRDSACGATTTDVLVIWADMAKDENQKFQDTLMLILGAQGAVGSQMLAAAATKEWNTNSAMEFFYVRMGQTPLCADEIQSCKEWLGEKFDACFSLYYNLFVEENAPWANHVLQGGISFRLLSYGYDMGKTTPVSVHAPLAGSTTTVSNTVEFQTDAAEPAAVTVSVAVETIPAEQSAPIPAVAAETAKPKEETMEQPTQAYTDAAAALAAAQAAANAANAAQAAAPAPEPAPAQVRTPPPAFPFTGNGKGEGLLMKSAKVVGYTVAGAVAVCVGVTAARYVASHFELSFDA